jgi:putative phosphoesterase
MDFVSLWDMTKEKGTFEELRRLMSSSGTLGKTLSLINSENPRLALISDIHGNLQALEAVLEDANARGIRAFVNAGDFVGYGAFPDEAVKALRALEVPSVIGNFDLKVLEGSREGNSNKEKDVAFKFARERLSKSSRRYLASLPDKISFEIGGKTVLLTHGSPESLNEHLDESTPGERLMHLAKVTGADVIVIGHSHRQFSKTVDGATFINPGGVGRSDDGDPRAAYAVIAFNPLKVEMIRLDYDYGVVGIP